ncbi:MAG: hypothetical protein ACLPXT_12985 [Terracidiphilus sp.]
MLNKTRFQEQSSMCAKTHTKYRNIRKGLPEKCGFYPKKGGIFPDKWPKMPQERPELCGILALKLDQISLRQIAESEVEQESLAASARNVKSFCLRGNHCCCEQQTLPIYNQD